MTAMFTVRPSGLIIAITGSCVFMRVEIGELMGCLSAVRMTSACTVYRALHARDNDEQEKDCL